MWDLTLPSLWRHFEKAFRIGNIISARDFDDAELLRMYTHHYNAVTAENDMKPESINPERGVFCFEKADKIVEWANKNAIDVIGHTLVWHGQTPSWFTRNQDGTPLTYGEARENMESFIKAYAGRYSGKIHAWDVVNEAFVDTETDEPYSGSWRDYLRRQTDNPRAVGHWFLAYENGGNGADFVFDAFYFARKYDPHATLYYNEYNEEYLHKRLAIADMVADINNQWRAHPDYDDRLLIEGIGMQSHHSDMYTDIGNVRAALEKFSGLGVVIAISEMDITFGVEDSAASAAAIGGGQADSAVSARVTLAPEQARKQAEMYEGLFRLYLEYAEYIERVTFWGKNDGQSWRKWGSPLLFDGDGGAKEAFFGVVEI